MNIDDVRAERLFYKAFEAGFLACEQIGQEGDQREGDWRLWAHEAYEDFLRVLKDDSEFFLAIENAAEKDGVAKRYRNMNLTRENEWYKC